MKMFKNFHGGANQGIGYWQNKPNIGPIVLDPEHVLCQLLYVFNQLKSCGIQGEERARGVKNSDSG